MELTACKWDSVIPFEPMWKDLKELLKTMVVLLYLVVNHLVVL
jgi:hypothetical protein